MSNKFTLVTGASSDIGLETVKLLLRNDELVWGIYNNNQEKLMNLKDQYTGNLMLSKHDFLNTNDLKIFIDDIVEKKRQIKSFISLASIRKSVEYGKISSKDLNEHFLVNVIPVVLVVQELGEVMSEQGYGRIVIGSSIGVKFGGSNSTYCYSVTKYATELLPKKSKEWVASNVLSNVVRIGVTETNSMKNKNLNERTNLIPIKRSASPLEVAKFLTWLSSSANTYISNQVISFSGGE